MTVLDLGAAPGGWSQVAVKLVGEKGLVIASDILPMDPVAGVEFIQGDFTEEEVLEEIINLVDQRPVDLVISDMAPNMSGMADIDQPRAMYLVELAFELACQALSPGGSVVVFDDVTELLQAQRDAAWGEVARRLAHEIKNPLTPIQLSAERIRRRYLGSMKDAEAEVLDRATHTIVAQVEAMRDMVNAFSEYARAPELTISHFELNQLVREVAYLYPAGGNHARLQLDLDEQLKEVAADDLRVRQLLHNLIRNSMEATEGQDDACIEITTRLLELSDREYAEISVSDNGTGIDPATMEQVFDPYVTTKTKTKGTGLGLAIVKRLVEEHGGTVVAENPEAGGARVIVTMPITQLPRHDQSSPRDQLRRERA